jgi:hypothetical protein
MTLQIIISDAQTGVDRGALDAALAASPAACGVRRASWQRMDRFPTSIPRMAAPQVDNAANAALIDFIAAPRATVGSAACIRRWIPRYIPFQSVQYAGEISAAETQCGRERALTERC